MSNHITHVRKRSGKYVLFDENKIMSAVTKSMEAAGEGTKREAEDVAELVIKKLNEDFVDRRPTVEDVQDRVEGALIELQHAKVAKTFILYRHERSQLREQKSQLIGGKVDDIDINLNGLRLLEQRYLLRDDEGKVIEAPSQLFWRVASKVAMAEHNYGGDTKSTARAFYQMMSKLEFLPSSPILMNAGTDRQLAGCVVLPIEDNLESIFQTLAYAVMVQKRGAGTGFSFSRLRSRHDVVGGISGVTTGPISFMRIYENALRTIKQGGKRRGANMAVLRVDHPDILDFINVKLDGQSLSNFNLSVAITDAFMEAVENDQQYTLINPRTGEPSASLSARVVFDSIVSCSWRVGDPGVLFIDRLNEANPCKQIGVVESTSPCGEQPLLPYQSCTEGSINLVACIKRRKREERTTLEDDAADKINDERTDNRKDDRKDDRKDRDDRKDDRDDRKEIRADRKDEKNEDAADEEQSTVAIVVREMDWERLRKVTREAVRFLDDTIDVNNYPIPEMDRMAKGMRKIGLGIMGFADLLYELLIPYDSEDAVVLGERIAKTIADEADKMSQQLYGERGLFKMYKGSDLEKKGHKRRNSTLLGIAPTGTISLIADVSSGIEPNYALAYTRTVADGRDLLCINPSFERVMTDFDVPAETIRQIGQRGMIAPDDKDVPAIVRRVLVTSQQIRPEWHIKMQAAFQKHVDGAISKTINFPSNTNIKEIGDGLMLAWKSGCKGITVYRDGSLPSQVLTMGNSY